MKSICRMCCYTILCDVISLHMGSVHLYLCGIEQASGIGTAPGMQIRIMCTMLGGPSNESNGSMRCRDVWREAGIDVNTLYTEQRNGSGPENQDLWVRDHLLSATYIRILTEHNILFIGYSLEVA